MPASVTVKRRRRGALDVVPHVVVEAPARPRGEREAAPCAHASSSARFPPDFTIRLDAGEHAAPRSQSATLEPGRGRHGKYLPHAFTEHGALMAASVLSTPRAVDVGIFVVRAFVMLQDLMATNAEMARRMGRAERRLSGHDTAIGALLEAVRELSSPPAPAKKRPIGFVRPKAD